MYYFIDDINQTTRPPEERFNKVKESKLTEFLYGLNLFTEDFMSSERSQPNMREREIL